MPAPHRLHATELRLHALFMAGLAGDAGAYRAFLQASASHLRAYLRRRLQSWPDAVEDLVQEALLAIHNQRLTYDPAAPLSAWMQAIARYKLVDWLRRHGRRQARDVSIDVSINAAVDGGRADLFEGGELAADDGLEASNAARDLAVLLATLPAKQRDAIVATRLDGLSVREAALQLQLSEADVKVSVHRGLKALALRLRDGD